MSSTAEALAAIEVAVEVLVAADWSGLPVRDRLEALDGLETVDMPGYLAEVHHVDEWTDGGHTNIDRLAFACGPHHKLIKPGGWRTRKDPDGTTQWLPPPHLPIPRGANTFHHPERMISRDDP